MTGTYDPDKANYSELHESRLVIRVEVVGSSDAANVGYWDTVQGGQVSRTVTPRKQPGIATIKKVPAMHRAISQLTLSRAWNTELADRKPIHDLVAGWLNGETELSVKVTQMVFNEKTKTYEDLEEYSGPVVSYEGPKGNSDGENFVKETLVIDPDKYNFLGKNAGAAPTTPTKKP